MIRRSKKVADALYSLEREVEDAEMNGTSADNPGAKFYRPVLDYVRSLEVKLDKAREALRGEE